MKKLINKFIIIIPLYNAQDSIIDCLLSVLKQKFDDVGIIIRDDMSTDNSLKLVKDFLEIRPEQIYANKNSKDILVISNHSKFYGGGNTYDSVVNYIDNDEAIVGVVDGDDTLISNLVLEKISFVYESKNVWQVWSQHRAKSWNNGPPMGHSSKLPSNNLIYSDRNYWSVSHFRTCRAWLFLEIDRNDLYDPFTSSLFCKYAADASILYPIIEMCGNEKSYFLDEVLYFYNDELPTNEFRISKDSVEKYSKYIRQIQNRYSRIEVRKKRGVRIF